MNIELTKCPDGVWRNIVQGESQDFVKSDKQSAFGKKRKCPSCSAPYRGTKLRCKRCGLDFAAYAKSHIPLYDESTDLEDAALFSIYGRMRNQGSTFIEVTRSNE